MTIFYQNFEINSEIAIHFNQRASSKNLKNLSINKLKFHTQSSSKRQILGIFQKSCFIVICNLANIESNLKSLLCKTKRRDKNFA